ncbi:SpvB/TcaC N-terminal domain-containing protein [Pseudomonas alkylphenolica]|uniref:Virulence plasmid B protein n=1 Tax=Pseudomonas alkylphenolica TaxID=237609 RepID=A0A077F8J3_9PSED|nr:SpvB/TcaC N-terminal domain-containing protein [Pseudomonas alkylphenolica]AIL61797.1 virulence plasmid B protein [Pseudomonas alkylphenolica]
MNDQAQLSVNPPALPKAGGAIQSIGKGFGGVGTTGAASLELPLPISPGRGFAPALGLGYSSDVGNSPFGIGWRMTTDAITLRTTKGVPTYDGNDQVVGPSGDVWMAERTESDGKPISRVANSYNGVKLDDHTVVRYWPRVEGGFDLIEHWSNTADPVGFWLIHGADGSLHLYGKNKNARRADPNDETHVGVWMIEESLNTRGEHIVYEYKPEQDLPAPPQHRDYRAQCYLERVCYGNQTAYPHLYAWSADSWKSQHWHFQLVFDYGERSADLEQVPAFEEQQPWSERSDPFWNYAYGFELGTRRLCRQVLMFHHFPNELGPDPVLVQRLLLEHRPSPLGYNHLTAAHVQAYDSLGQVESRPPLEFSYNAFDLSAQHQSWVAFPEMPGLNDGQRYQLVDLYGEGMPGVLCRYDKGWYYREPLRGKTGGNEVSYGDWQPLPRVPLADSRKPVQQSLTDLTGDGKLDWLVARPGMGGFFTLDPDRTWSNFVPFDAFPIEFFNPLSQMTDLQGGGLSDLALIGPRSVRLYGNRREAGFAGGLDVPRRQNDDDLPLLSNLATELVAFADIIGSGQPHLLRIRHNEVKCWPNLGHGRFGKGFVLCALPFKYAEFNAAQVLLADLDGSGAADLIYLTPDCIQVFMNRSGNGYDLSPIELPWPEGVRYDPLCQVTTADLQGLGCSSLILTVPHMAPRHWRYDFVKAKPYLVNATCNNMGATSHVTYRSSAQEWLDEKQEQIDAGVEHPVSELPFAMHLVSRQTQLDEITGNRLTQGFKYRGGFYDHFERELRGFALLLQTDTEATPAERSTAGFTAPILSKTWFHTGKAIDASRSGYYAGDPLAVPLKSTVLQNYHFNDRSASPLSDPDVETAREIARALSGRVMRTEVFAADDAPATAVPYAVNESRYLVRVLRTKGKHQPYAVLQPLDLEAISYQYEPLISDDPLCQHTLNLEWDEYDAYWCLSTAVTLPDGCTTRSLDIDYRTFLPAAIEDANANIQEARYSAFGEPLVTSFYGTEMGEPVGFDPLTSYVPPPDRDPVIAIHDPKLAIGRFASAGFWDTFSWMGRISRTSPPSSEWLDWARAAGFVLPSGHLCSRARQHLEGLENLDVNATILKQQIDAAQREPVYSVGLLADRYPGDEEMQVRVSIACLDGFGRTLQTKQEVEPGKSWLVDENGELLLQDDGTPQEAEVPRRWRVSEPVEYNNKGEKVRVYRPYFADQPRYINDRSMRQHAYHDQQFYDAAGRPTETVLAKKMLQGNPPELKSLRREMWYWVWSTVAFDENDLFDPPPAQPQPSPWLKNTTRH